jgi:hypothetical protein
MISNFGSTNKNKLFELFQESLKIVLKLEKWIINYLRENKEISYNRNSTIFILIILTN